jgi:hypothetical protein
MNVKISKENIYISLILIIMISSFYYGVATFIFAWRHPKANNVQPMKYIYTTLTFGTVPELE